MKVKELLENQESTAVQISGYFAFDEPNGQSFDFSALHTDKRKLKRIPQPHISYDSREETWQCTVQCHTPKLAKLFIEFIKDAPSLANDLSRWAASRGGFGLENLTETGITKVDLSTGDYSDFTVEKLATRFGFEEWLKEHQH